ncbi:MAG: hypothetical protein KF713_11310 [Turneriella sp.]|nr:hypothetical protein [Turneriella sp.]
MKFSSEIKQFINDVDWIWAKTYALTWPHHYIVRKYVDGKLFNAMVTHIRNHGTEGRFYRKRIIYFEEEGLVYWTMVPPMGNPDWYPVDEEIIINRCPKEHTYESRLMAGTLPA